MLLPNHMINSKVCKLRQEVVGVNVEDISSGDEAILLESVGKTSKELSAAFSKAGEDSDVDALVLAAAAGLQKQCLVVAACGPASLLLAARKSVAAAHKQCHGHGVRLVFSGADSSW